MNQQAASKAQDIQHMVLWSIGGPVALVLALFLLSKVFIAAPVTNADSWVLGLGAVLHYCAHFGAVLTTPVIAAFGLLGLVRLRNAQVKRKALTLAVCACAFGLPLALLAALYIGK
jgi:hypothetical protein